MKTTSITNRRKAAMNNRLLEVVRRSERDARRECDWLVASAGYVVGSQMREAIFLISS
jgi:hypothetical protein